MKMVVLTDIGLDFNVKGWEEVFQRMEVKVYHNTPDDLVVERAEDAEILVTNKVLIMERHLRRLPNVRYIIMASTGTNVVDLDYCHAHGIWCSNVPAYSTDSVAQLVFSHLLNIFNPVAHYADKNRLGAWTSCPDFYYADAPTYELAGKTLGIVGLGAIGQRVALIALAFGMNVVAYTSKTEAPQGLQPVRLSHDLDEVFALSNILTLHCPLTEQTNKLVNAESISKMRQGVVIVNTARGGLVDDPALRDALISGKVSAFAADVLSTEPPRSDNPLSSLPNVYVTPHLAWATQEALVRLNNTILRNIAAYLSDGKPVDVV